MTDHQWLIFCKVTGVWAFFLVLVWFAVGIGSIEGNEWMVFSLVITCFWFAGLAVAVTVIFRQLKKKGSTK